ncbi:MAG: NAD(P)/FAD-dependent oxidoreductase [Acidobacteriota bacterium]|nr:NAD(P)/FAD-dependent oxidoreductase [Acidobacteriota bacterium]
MTRAARVDVIVIGAGHNGLVAAERLARAGFSTLVLEQRPTVGGAASNALAHSMPPVHPALASAIPLRGLEWVQPDIPLTALDASGKAIPFYRDHRMTAEALAVISPKDAARYGQFVTTLEAVSRVTGAILEKRPPSIDDPSLGDLIGLANAGRKFKALDRRTAYGLLRWGPMPIADFVDEWFSNSLLKAAIAARGLLGAMLGPRSAGSTLTYLYQLALDPHPTGSGLTVAGGISAFSDALATAAAAAGATIRVSSPVRQILVDQNRVTGVSLESGETIECRAVVSAAGPKRTLLDLIEPGIITPDVVARTRNIRARGVTAKVNLSLDALPVFPALAAHPSALRGRVHVGPDVDYLERAFDATKYGESSSQPWLEIAVPSTHDTSLAPAGKHVMSIYAQYAPRHLRGRTWTEERPNLLRAVMGVLETVAPGIERIVVNADVITPEDLEVVYGMDGGNINHAEHALDQMIVARPLLGLNGYAAPLEGLYLSSGGSHPGGGITGLPGLLAAHDVAQHLKKRPRTRPPS